jgi:hypothetical protein
VVIYALSRRHRVDHSNVTDSREVFVLASAAARAYARKSTPEKKTKKPKARSGAR